jgi:hypothetical protein
MNVFKSVILTKIFSKKPKKCKYVNCLYYNNCNKKGE